MSKTVEELEEEIFCLKFELHTLAKYMTEGKLERWVPGFTDPLTHFDHEQRYLWACNYVKDKTVLDIACGCGRGSFLLSTIGTAKQVTGGDIEKEAIQYAKFNYKRENVQFIEYDILSKTLDKKFDVIISFETVEHIKQTEEYLNSLANNLAQNGILIISTPLSEKEIDLNPLNPYHVKEWGFESFQEQINKFFKIDEVFLQIHSRRVWKIKGRILHLLNRKKYAKHDTQLFKYDKNKFNANMAGKEYTGYQIVVCKKKINRNNLCL